MANSKFPTRYYSSRQEKHIAKELGGKQVINSGATRFSKGDVSLEDWLIEAKTCTSEKRSFSIKREWLGKNEEEAFAMGKSYSALAFDFGDGEQHYIISEKLFKLLVNYLNKEEN